MFAIDRAEKIFQGDNMTTYQVLGVQPDLELLNDKKLKKLMAV